MSDKCYIYGLRAQDSNKFFYVGSTKRSLEWRLSKHRNHIVSGLHRNPRFTETVNAIGVDNVTIELIEEVEQDQRFQREAHWINTLPDLINIVKNPKKVEPARVVTKRQYSDNDKAIALATLDANNGNIRQSAKILRLPESTLTDWANNKGVCPEVTEIREEKKTELSQKLEAVAHALTDNILLRAQSDFSVLTPLKDFAVSLGIAVDKMQVLKGEPTSISKDVSERTNEERAARILELVRPAKTG